MAYPAEFYPAPAERILRLPQVEEMVGLRRSRIDDLVKAGVMPQPVRLHPGGRAIGWLESELLAWIRTRPRVVYPSTDAED